MKDFVSVIITAYNRQKYLGYALNSVLNQTLDKDKFEIVVITNFEFNKPNYKNIIDIYDNQEYLGEKIYKGLHESKGDIICLLDDDDMYREDKLERVTSFFKTFYPIYYHNNFVTIDDKGNEIKIIEEYLKIPPYASFNLPEFTLAIENNRKTDIRNLLKLNVNFNSSSICVRREILENNAQYLRKIKAVIDSFIFYSSLLLEGNILLDPARLTYYRIHTLQTSSGNTKNIKEYKDSFSNLFKKAVEDFYIITEMLNGKINENILEIVNEELLRYKLLYKIFSGNNILIKTKFNIHLLNYYLLSLLPTFLGNLYIKDQYNRTKKVRSFQVKSSNIF
ncbi:glycosyltransferase [Stygiolobus azoricus]|uniref:Glycosyltransferase n=1 Tax=Stygiolobus azoricus TaxID=41675 RepID=A0A650CPN3_9CREN|nr:glycosyltransferase [Stygiolobus azoricus]QGR19799.1 glycosyltransferase [Stygiolobus azoricus]